MTGNIPWFYVLLANPEILGVVILVLIVGIVLFVRSRRNRGRNRPNG